MLEFILFAISIIFLWLLLRSRSAALSDVPGPKPYPIFGNVLQLNLEKFYVNLAELAKEYGGIYKLYVFTKPILVVSDSNLIQEVLVTQSANFAGRPCFYRGEILKENLLAVSIIDAGPVHKGRRKVMHAFLKQFGSGIQKIESVTQAATEDLINRLDRDIITNGAPIDISKFLFHCVTDVTVILLRGETLDSDEIDELDVALDKCFGDESPASGIFLDMFPFVRFLGNTKFREFQEVIVVKDRMVKEWMEGHPPEGFIHHLQSMPAEEQDQSFMDSYRAQSNAVFEFLGAGVITTTTTLTCLMNVLVHYPDVQAKLRQEVLEVVGYSRCPSLKDKENLPYLRAALLEIGRFSSVVPIALPHKTMQDCQLGGCAIPKDQEVLVNLWGLHHDDDLWDEPFTFMPERFLDDDGQLVPADHPHRKNVLPFGAGQRVCVGEVFAMSRMFLITARILQHFTVLPESSVEKQPSCDPRDMKMGPVLLPPPFKVRLEQSMHNLHSNRNSRTSLKLN